MLHISNLHKAFGDRVLFDKVSWHLQPGMRVGLCGPNGAGKTTLLKMLSGEVEPDAGEIARPNDLTVGYLPQDGLTHAGRTLYDETSRAFEPLLALQAELGELETRLGDTSLSQKEHDGALDRYSEVQTAFQDRDGYGIEAKVDAVLRGLGFEAADFGKPTETFSGGWQMRIALAKLLLSRPRLLLLDEPTNHLDLEARNWLEEFLIDYPDAVVLVSHDRYFLDSVVTEIAEVGLRTLTEFRGTYSAYLTEREARIARLREAKKRQDEEVARMRMFIDRFRYKATKAKQVQSRVKMLEKITPIEVPPARKRVHFKFPASAKSGRTVVELRDVGKAYGDVRVFERANVHIERGDRVALVGPNGAGKSTLMRMLSGVEAPDRGERLEGYRVITQYFAQDEAVRLDGSLTVVRDAGVRLPGGHGPRDPQHPGRLPVHRGRRLQARQGALGRRAHTAGGGADAAAPFQHAHPGRADQPPRHRLDRRAARRPDRLRRHPHLRLARPLLRRPAGDEDHRRRAWRGGAVPGQLRGVPLEPGAGARQRRGRHAAVRRRRTCRGSEAQGRGRASDRKETAPRTVTDLGRACANRRGRRTPREGAAEVEPRTGAQVGDRGDTQRLTGA